MVLVDIHPKEIEAFDRLIAKANAPIPIGFVIGTLRVRIQEAITKEQDKQLKDKYAPKKKAKD